MRFSRDRRGQSVVVGTVILFGFLIVALGIFQIQVVPTENANVEFEHSQQVEDDFGDLRNDVLRAGSTGSTGSTQVRLGTRYPARTFFINPPPVSGSLETEPTGPIRVLNATVGDGAHQNARDFWNTSPSFETRSLRYDVEYNEFDGAPELVYEHSVVAAEFDDAVLLRTGQTAVSEERISLTALTGSVSETGVVPRSVDPRAVSASDTTVPLEPRGGQITLELPTAVGNASALAERWNGALPAGATATRNATGEAINVTLANGSDPYRLALSEVSLDATGKTEPAYVVPVGSESAAVGETVTVEVRDRYNNPVPDATVAFDGANRTTGDGGRAFFEVNETEALIATINGTGGPTYERVTFDVSEGGGTAGNQTFDVRWIPSSPVNATENTDTDLEVQIFDRQSGDLINDATIDYSFAPLQNGGSPSLNPLSSPEHDGSDTLVFSPNNADVGDEFHVYAAAGDDVDRLLVRVIESGQGTMADRTTVTGEDTAGGNNDVTFTIGSSGPDTQSIEITDITVESVETNTGNTDVDNVEDTEGDTFVNAGTDTTLVSGQIDVGTTATLSPTLQITGGNSADVRLGQFRDGNQNANMNKANVELTLQFSDGSSKTFLLTL
ncbi:hypothetical protein PM076_10680 [Halorubrum ezzemoulense]|nr:hypothetical protein [Halorubrum ezzemoulense]MDB2243937.1 hypothetical protein [Halorubrum ezzemoulense]MDB2252003.1 hypothetical protein [Halorubrum ezzemoulense]MDB2277673.1 hypothetical protein [Halorubrum ezzemoulense]MDB2284383.1 hypothetical protein [Halorubrum ezzemoulense]MDB2289300.1 hypothetical protein [Halorubrum ezzemoulense]